MPKAKTKAASVQVSGLSKAQLSKLEELVQPDRWVDESFNRTEIGAVLLKEQLIAPNPDQGSRKAYIVTPQGITALKEARNQ